MENKIPKIIHQIWIGPNKKPNLWMDTWSKNYINKYPDFKYKLWNEKNIGKILDKYPLSKILFNLEVELCGKADILRYLILYEIGGIYIDADSVWINEKNLNELIENTNSTGVFAGLQPSSDEIANGVFGCTKNNKIILGLINDLENKIKWGDKVKPVLYKRARKIHGVSRITGPKFFSSIIKKNITIFPPKYFYPVSWFDVKEIDMHLKMELPKESYMFQYGYTTNKFRLKIK